MMAHSPPEYEMASPEGKQNRGRLASQKKLYFPRRVANVSW